MPAHAKGPISHPVIGANGKLEKVLTYATGAHLTDEQIAVLGDEYKHVLTPIQHNDHTCPLDCAHDSHEARKADDSAAAADAKALPKPEVIA